MMLSIYNPVQGKFIYHKALKLSNPVPNPAQVRVFRKNYRDKREFVAQHNSNIGTRRAQLRNISLGGFRLIDLSYDYTLIRLIATFTGHLGASCSNIGRIRTKENIVVGTLLIGAMPALEGHLGASCSNIGRIRTK